jgi:hypothetical protein
MEEAHQEAHQESSQSYSARSSNQSQRVMINNFVTRKPSHQISISGQTSSKHKQVVEEEEDDCFIKKIDDISAYNRSYFSRRRFEA